MASAPSNELLQQTAAIRDVIRSRPNVPEIRSNGAYGPVVSISYQTPPPYHSNAVFNNQPYQAPPSYDHGDNEEYKHNKHNDDEREKEIQQKLKKIQDMEQKLREKIEQDEREKEMKALYSEYTERAKKDIEKLKQDWLTNDSNYGRAVSDANPAFMKVIEKFFSSEIVLYLIVVKNNSLYGVVTTRGLFFLLNIPSFHFCPIYIFNNCLDKHQLMILDQLFKDQPFNRHSMRTNLVTYSPEGGERLEQRSYILWNFIDRCKTFYYERKFESVIRLIPGSYKNGAWRQLDGFFGMYFNEKTLELSDVPPPFEL